MTATPFWKRPAAGILLAALLFALMLAGPGETITTVYINDLLIFIDGAHRIASGQVPNRDFHTALGPLTYYVPAIGYWISGTLGGAFPVGMGLLVVALAPALVHILTTRLRAIIALPFGVFLLLILAVPMNLGESIGSLSFAMFYNRVGWVALAALLVMYLPADRPGPAQSVLDTLSAAFLTLLMVYTKVTYGLVGLAFLAFLLLDRRQRLWAAGAIGLTILGGLVVEFFWRSSAAHLADLILTGHVSGVRRPEDLVLGFLRHLADYVMFGALVALALWRSRSPQDVLFFGFCAVPGLLIMNQNSQPWGIITIHAGAAVAAEILLRADASRETARHSINAGGPFILFALILPTSLHCFLALGLHAGLAATKSGEPFGLPQFDGMRLARLWAPGDDAFSTAYIESIRDGARALESLPVQPEQVSVLDFANPFSAGLGLPPPRGDSAWLHWGRNVNTEYHLPPDRMLGDVKVLMEPKWGVNNLPLSELYGPYIREAFEPVLETGGWTVHLRRNRSEVERLADPSGNLGAGPVLGLGNGTSP